jgi:hypothetical protein
MSQLFSNNASTTLNGGITNSVTSLVVSSTTNFPTISNIGDYFYATITDNISNWEIVKVTATSGTTFTVVRGQDNTTALAWSNGVVVEIRPVAQGLRDISNYTATGGSVASSLQSLLDKEGVNVLSFGAIPNNLTFDQSFAFNNAIAYAAANNISKVIVPCGKYACNILITQSYIYLEGNQSGAASGGTSVSNIYLTPWNIANPVIQVGNDTAVVAGVTLSNLVLNGGSPNGNGQTGLFLAGGCNGINLNSVNAGFFAGTAILLGPSNNYPVEYINFVNCNWFAALSTFTTVFGAYSTGTSWTSATYLSNCNIQSNANGYAIIITGTGITWNGGWIQANSGKAIKFGNGGSLTGWGTNMEVNSPYEAIDIPDLIHLSMTEWITGSFSITSGATIKDSGGTQHAINTNGGLAGGSEIAKNCVVLGDLFFTGSDGNGGVSTADNMHISGGYDGTGSLDMVNSSGTTSVNTRLRSDGAFLVQSASGTQFVVAPVTSANNWVQIQGSNSGSPQIGVTNNSESGMIGLSIVTQSGGMVQVNGYNIITSARGLATKTNAGPPGTTSTSTPVMMGLDLTLTPTLTTRALVNICGQMANSVAGDGVTVDIRYYTGTAPINGASLTGAMLLIGQSQTTISLTAGQKSGFSITAPITGLNDAGATTYWFDLSVMAVTGGTATVTGVTATVIEV